MLTPALPSAPIRRILYISQEVYSFIFGPWVDTAQEIRAGYLRTDLDVFIVGGVIGVARQPYQARTAYISRLDAPRDEVWEIRSRHPKPGIRVFGRFSETDVFIALTWSNRTPLGGPGSREWRDAIERCKTEWRNLFPAYNPISGSIPHDYISTDTFFV